MARPAGAELQYNTALIDDPAAFAREHGAESWLFLCGEAFAAMDGGMSFADAQAAVPVAANVISDPPRELDVDLARLQVAALDALPRPTLVTCRSGGRSSALVHLYEGLRSGDTAEAVLGRAEAEGAPFVRSPETRAWVEEALRELGG